MLNGYKTYVLSGLLFVYAAAGFVLGKISGADALAMIYSSGVVAALRMGITNEIAKLKQ